jgi:hypothetical protein
MTAADFQMAVKSTLDRIGHDLVTASGAVGGVDLDDTVNVDDILTNEDSLILWQLLSMDEYPRDPMYRVVFGFGGKTCKDPGNYSLVALQQAVSANLFKGAHIELRDYSGASPSEIKGSLTVTQASMTPQEVENDSGLRMFMFSAAGLRRV